MVSLRISSNSLRSERASRTRLARPAMAIPASLTPSLREFDAHDARSFRIAIMGDLHLPAGEPGDRMREFHEAREQLVQVATSVDTTHHAARVVQLGDLGSSEKGWPGSRKCFNKARQYIASFGLPAALILGNHDLEGDEFETDEENLSAWKEAFCQNHYWRSNMGPAIMIGLSTVRFRSNPFSVHEVHIDEEQLMFLEETLEEATAEKRPVVLFTHAPPMGSGLKAIQSLHVKNRCAWLNHSSDPKKFSELCQRFPCIKLHFSGHFHLSQNYPDAINIVGGTAFVLTGVIGDSSSRDGHRQSRILCGKEEGYELYTIDHDTASMRLDLRGSWEEQAVPEYLVPEDELICDPSDGWLCSKVDCDVSVVNGQGQPPQVVGPPTALWLNASATTMLTLQEEVLVEYDVATMAPVGAVFIDVPDGGRVRLVDSAGSEIDAINTSGAAAVAVEVVDSDTGEVVRRAERNPTGSFYQIFQPNKWVIRKEKEHAEKEGALQAA